jgi:plasmid maintenance system antidote protein VapI
MGLSMKEFANELGAKESEIQNIIRQGIITEKLLDTICTYFHINKTEKNYALYSAELIFNQI